MTADELPDLISPTIDRIMQRNGYGPKMSPIEIRFLLHCYACGDPFDPWSRVIDETVDKMVEEGLIRPGDTPSGERQWVTTKHGNRVVEQLLAKAAELCFPG